MVRGAVGDAHEHAGRGDAARRRPPRARARRHRAGRGAGRGAQPLPAAVPQRLSVGRACGSPRSRRPGRLRLSLTAMSTSSELRTPAMTERIAAAFGVDAVRPLRDHRGPVRLRVRAPRRHPPVRRRQHRRERRRGRPPGAARHAGRARARHQPPQPRAADHPARGRRRHDACTPSRARAGARSSGRRRSTAATTTCSRCPRAAAGRVTVLPAQFSVITRDRAVREFQVRQEPGGVRVLVVPCGDGDPELEARLRGAVAQALGEAGRRRACRGRAPPRAGAPGREAADRARPAGLSCRA